MLSDVPHGKFGFTKGSIIAVIWFSFRGLLTVANLALTVLSFGSQRHSFWLWTCVCVMHLHKMTFKQMC
ncbi:hypothetical protein VCHC1A2_3664 [Vibrio cholerae HC-1A2]|nr:hypothetical protein VCHC1A2_3664 [Vibrio cholerae HC-1A2]